MVKMANFTWYIFYNYKIKLLIKCPKPLNFILYRSKSELHLNKTVKKKKKGKVL